MTPGIIYRPEKLEAAMRLPGGAGALRLLTDDELDVRLLDLSRRAALRARPDIAALIAEGARA